MLRHLLLALASALAVAATAQPTWRFHLAFEDGTGARDTLWFIWDTTATIFYGEATLDHDLGETPVDLDHSEFNIWMGCGFPYQLQTDAQPYSGPGVSYPWFYSFQICGENITSPLIMRWDTSLFNAPFLPEPVRYAAMNGEYFFWHPDGYFPDFPDDYIIPDQVWFLMGRDSVVFQGVESDPPFPMYLILGDWENHLSIQESRNGELGLTVNNGRLMIESNSRISDILITDAAGRMVFNKHTEPSDHIMIDIPDLPPGFYVVVASNPLSSAKITGKFINP